MNQTRFWVTAATGGSYFNPLPKLEGEGRGGNNNNNVAPGWGGGGGGGPGGAAVNSSRAWPEPRSQRGGLPPAGWGLAAVSPSPPAAGGFPGSSSLPAAPTWPEPGAARPPGSRPHPRLRSGGLGNEDGRRCCEAGSWEMGRVCAQIPPVALLAVPCNDLPLLSKKSKRISQPGITVLHRLPMHNA